MSDQLNIGYSSEWSSETNNQGNDQKVYTFRGENLKHIPFEVYENNENYEQFVFLVPRDDNNENNDENNNKNNEKFPTSRFLADLLSPKISKYHKLDKKRVSFEIKTKHRGDFNKILNFAKNGTISLTSDEVEYFREVMRILGNTTELANFCPEVHQDITKENIFIRINQKRDGFLSIEDELNYISSHFDELYNEYEEQLSLLDCDILERIFHNPNLKVLNEDILFTFALNLYEQSDQYSSLFENILFSNVSKNNIQKFLELFDVNQINAEIWRRLSERILNDLSTDSLEAMYNQNIDQYNSRYGHKLNIIEYLTQKCGGNVKEKGEIIVKSSKSNGELENIFEQSDDKSFCTANNSNGWILFDFKQRRVQIDTYSLKTGKSQYHLKNWCLEASDDGNIFEVIGREEDCSKLNGQSQQSEFKAKHNKPQRYIRLRMDGVNWNNNYCLELNQIGFTGQLLYYLSFLNHESNNLKVLNINEYLSHKCNGKIVSAGLISVSCSPPLNSGNYENLFDDSDGSNAIINSNSAGAYILFDFKNIRVNVKNYTLKCQSYYLKSWVLEASDDPSNFIPIDEENECKELNGAYKLSTFNTKHDQFQRYIRLRMTDTNWNGNFYLSLNQIIFYGFVQE